jgi:hypothetical protein
MSEELGIIQLDTNLSDIDRPPELPVGRYVGEIQSVEVKTSAAGNEYFAIRILIPGDHIPAEVAEHYEDGALFFWNRMLVPKGNDRRSLWNLRQFIEKIGLNSNTNEINPNEWMNQNVGVVIGMSKNLEGELRAEVKSLFAAEDVPARHEEEVEVEVVAPTPTATIARGRRRG